MEELLTEPGDAPEGPGAPEAPSDQDPAADMDALVDTPAADTSTTQAVPPPLALYRRYRPDSFADLIGQEHVTEPLQRALENDKVNHAYLFSGPRGCGKTTSARILARALNCANGPAAEPCGVCQSCRDLATGGPGSIDVIEIDAASHGGVDDARDLRERAFFAPVNSRYKIYVIDEAHMVTSAGFNALLRLVEEPPPHVKFVFATTEPDKVIGTIRSRTHHYPFRLVPPRMLADYLATVCERESIQVENGVLPLVVRAGAGSVRDSLSVLDQLLGGAGDRGVSYRQAAALLGYTPDSLLDEMLDAIAAGDAAGVFRSVDKVIEVGQDPRRFAEDLLRRVRDLVIVASVPDAMSSGLLDVAEDQAERLGAQAAKLGAGELTRAGEVLAAGLTEMRGTTAPRLHLELMCSRVMLPATDLDDRGVHARLDRLERRMGMPGTAPAPGSETTHPGHSAAPPEPAAEAAGPAPPTPTPAGAPPEEPAGQTSPRGADAPPNDAAPAAAAPTESQGPAPGPTGNDAPADPGTRDQPQPRPAEQPPPTGGSPAQQAAPSGGLTITDLRRLWPEVLEAVKNRRRFTWILLSQNATAADLTNNTLMLAMPNAGARDSFARGGSEDILKDALMAVIGVDLRIETMIDPSAAGSGRGTGPAPGGSGGGPAEPSSRGADAGPAEARPAVAASPKTPADPGAGPPDSSSTARQQSAGDPPWDPPVAAPDPAGPSEPTAQPSSPASDDWATRDAAADRTDETVAEGGETHTELLQRRLGAEVIFEEGPNG